MTLLYTLMLFGAAALVLAIVMGVWFLFDTDPDNDDHWGDGP